MSRNFELLQQAGWGIESFGPAIPDRGEREIKELKVEPRKQVAPERRARGMSRDATAKLVRRVFLEPGSKAPQIVLFSSARRGAGCSWLCARAGKMLAAETEERVCVMDANVSAPSLHRHFGQQNVEGFSSAVGRIESVLGFAKQIGPANLWLLACGPASEGRHIRRSPSLESIVSELRAEFDYVLVDAPSLDADPFAMVLGELTDGVILVLDSSGTPRDVACQAKRRIERANVPLLGIVLNEPPRPSPRLWGGILK